MTLAIERFGRQLIHHGGQLVQHGVWIASRKFAGFDLSLRSGLKIDRPISEGLSMNKNLQHVTRTLHDLIKALPAVRAHCSQEVLRQHVQLIAHFQRQYDQLINNNAVASPAV